MPQYRFDEVRAALHEYWGLALYRGGDLTDLGRDGRWDVAYSKTGYVVGGSFPGKGHSYRRYKSLVDVVGSCDLAKGIEQNRMKNRMKKIHPIRWKRSDDGFSVSHDGRLRISPIYGGLTRPESYQIWLDDKVVGSGATQRECKLIAADL
jgi:hypothetical protein